MSLTISDLSRLQIKSEQIRYSDLYHNAGWYGTNGQKLGWGDLSSEDIDNIKANLNEGEMFIILNESDSFWNFVTYNPGTKGEDCKTSPNESNPGKEYLFEKARAVILPDEIHEQEWSRHLGFEKEWKGDFAKTFAKALGVTIS